MEVDRREKGIGAWRFLRLVAGLLACAPLPTMADWNVLFIGNSFTFAYQGLPSNPSVPDIFEAMSKAGGYTNVIIGMRALTGMRARG